MFDQRLRRTNEALVGPLASRVGRIIGPGAVTAAAFVLTVAAASAAWAGLAWLAVAAWLASRLLDGLDGAVARARGGATDLGGYLDMVLDTVGYALVPIGVALWLDTRAGWISLAVMLAAFYVNTISWTYLSALAEKRAAGAASTGELTSITMPPALVEGAETIVVFTVFLAFPSAAPLIFSVMAGAVLVGVVQRGVWARRHL
ncbi:CDP-alcohol phosphatidyltransferase family protein [Rhabdothermincola salaria]|uniref:CDP-alcohol phosphatidyltransferase family protein n=1 Tax=Rhabdothermincola salaria TaxID=2903142 RepID=UPI001E41943F|nr:CDP-alcohol phosphatidyltransferase family protein [Rhabdothermincola salaria]MCD9624246.1 CDP-alcohol phosphatidyltransferase family protein [Rhabdothermincola salaria]